MWAEFVLVSCILDPEGLFTGGGGAIFKKIYVFENAFQAFLKPIFLYSINSISSKARHLVPSYYFAFLCRPLGALVRFPYAGLGVGGGCSNFNGSMSQLNV